MSASHHGHHESPEDRKRQADLMERFINQVERRASREYPLGRIGGEDEGSLAIAVAADKDHGIVRIDFGKSVEWLALPPKECVALAEMLIAKAREISREPIVLNIGR